MSPMIGTPTSNSGSRATPSASSVMAAMQVTIPMASPARLWLKASQVRGDTRSRMTNTTSTLGQTAVACQELVPRNRG